MNDNPATSAGSFVRGCLGALFLVAAYSAFDPVEGIIYHPLARALGLHMVVHEEMQLKSYAILMVIRLGLDLLVVAGVFAILRRGWSDFPLVGSGSGRLGIIGLATGALVMTAAILAIVITGNATVAASGQPIGSAVWHGLGWLLFDYIGAAGEELYGRVAVLMVAQALFGWRGAILVSGLMFSLIHLGNPGASWIWLARLFFQGVLLAYAVYRTGSMWWSVAYHTGWNWPSAPLFGAAGSGYLDQGHVFDFVPIGSPWITGGPVGPEGSVFAFVAVLCAFGLLMASTRAVRDRQSCFESSQAVHLREG